MRDSQRAGTGDFLGPSVAAWELSPDLFTPLHSSCSWVTALPPSLRYTTSVTTARGCTTLEGP